MSARDESIQDELLYRLTEALAQACERGEVIDDAAWASRFETDELQVRRARAAVELLMDDDGLPGLGDDEEAIELTPPALPGDYELLEELGRGGMGVVYRVHQKSLDRELALKVLLPGEHTARRTLQRFRREAKSLASLRHPHIARLHEVGECEGRVYFTMDLIEGSSLAARIAEGRITPSQAVRWLRQVSSAVRYVHGHGLIHRDLKPANILIDGEGDACVVDFGLARESEAQSELTRSGHFLGTPAYMAPEQARGSSDEIGECTDIYALGAVLYECLTGRAPFRGESIVELVRAVCDTPPIPPRKLDVKIPRELETICLKALSKQPQDRYATARALLEDLERFEQGRAILAQPPKLLQRIRTFGLKNRAVLWTTLATTLAVTALFWFVVQPRLANSDSSRLAVADQLLASGEASGALRLYEDAVGGSAPEELEPPLAARYASALLEQAAAIAGGDPTRAKEGYRRASEITQAALNKLPSDWEYDPARAKLCTLFIRASLGLGERGAVRSGLDQLREVLGWNQGLWQLAQQGEWLASTRSQGGANEDEGALSLARDYLPRLSDLGHPGHEAAALLWRVLLSGDERYSVLEALRVGDLPRELTVVALLRSADSFPFLGGDRLPVLSRSEHGDWWPVIERCQREVLVAKLRESAALSQASRKQRIALLRFLVAYFDLPEGIDPQLFDADLQALIETDPLEPAADLALRVGAVIRLIGEDHKRCGTSVQMWLAEHTAADAKDVQGWREWWEQHGTEDPRSWFLSALELKQLPERDQLFELLPRFDSASSSQRRLFHELFRSYLQAGERLPLWPSMLDGEPEELSANWHAALEQRGSSGTWRVRLAGLRWDIGELEPQLRWSAEYELRAGESLQHDIELQVASSAKVPPYLPELKFRRWSPPRPSTVSVSLRAELKWTRGGVRLDWDRMWWQHPPSWILQGAPDRGAEVGPGYVYSPALLSVERQEDDQPVVREVVLSLLEPVDASHEELDAAAWRAHIAADISDRLQVVDELDPKVRMNSEPGQDGPRLGHTLWLAGLLPEPTSAPELRALVGVYSDHGGGYLPTGGFGVTALLAAGDASPLEDRTLFQARIEHANHYVASEYARKKALCDGYWECLLLSTVDPAIRAEAAARLIDAQCAEEVLLELIAALEDLDRSVPKNLASHTAALRADRAGKARQRTLLVWLYRLFLGLVAYAVVRAARTILVGHNDPLRPVVLSLILMSAGLGLSMPFLFPRGGLERAACAALAAFGAWSVAARVSGRARFFAPLCFSIAFLAQLAALVGLISPSDTSSASLSELMTLAAVLGLPFLLHDLVRTLRRGKRIEVGLTIFLFCFYFVPHAAGVLLPSWGGIWGSSLVHGYPFDLALKSLTILQVGWVAMLYCVKHADVEALRNYLSR